MKFFVFVFVGEFYFLGEFFVGGDFVCMVVCFVLGKVIVGFDVYLVWVVGIVVIFDG